MATTYSLDQLRQDVEAKYGPFVVELGGGATATLHPILRLPQDRRETFARQYAELRRLQAAEADGDGAGVGDILGQLDEVGELLRGLLTTVAATPGDAERLWAALPTDDPTFTLELFERYAARSMPGEASPSPS
jgi:hypothetical protein